MPKCLILDDATEVVMTTYTSVRRCLVLSLFAVIDARSSRWRETGSHRFVHYIHSCK